ncbi:hypothetical protein D3C84_976390 [compost metagenome]
MNIVPYKQISARNRNIGRVVIRYKIANEHFLTDRHINLRINVQTVLYDQPVRRYVQLSVVIRQAARSQIAIYLDDRIVIKMERSRHSQVGPN